jgi:hypothetical protein
VDEVYLSLMCEDNKKTHKRLGSSMVLSTNKTILAKGELKKNFDSAKKNLKLYR